MIPPTIVTKTNFTKSANNPINALYFAELSRAINNSLLAAHNPFVRASVLLSYYNMLLSHAYMMYLQWMKHMGPFYKEIMEEMLPIYQSIYQSTVPGGGIGLFTPEVLRGIENRMGGRRGR